MNKTQLETVRKYLAASKRRDEDRKTLYSVQHCPDTNKQFILDGFTAYMWEQHAPELDAHPQTKAAESIRIGHIMPTAAEYTPTQDDLTMWKHIDEFAAYGRLKRKSGDTTGSVTLSSMLSYADGTRFAYLFGRYFDYSFIKTAKVFFGNDLARVKVYCDVNRCLSPVLLKNDKMTSILLPVRKDEIRKGLGDYVCHMDEHNKEFLKGVTK
jgi:hypothetical protein